LAWAGISNTYFWIDPTKGVAGLLLTQPLPFVDPTVLGIFEQFEQAIYAADLAV
jgi:methyl acetate hydrolase